MELVSFFKHKCLFHTAIYKLEDEQLLRKTALHLVANRKKKQNNFKLITIYLNKKKKKYNISLSIDSGNHPTSKSIFVRKYNLQVVML